MRSTNRVNQPALRSVIADVTTQPRDYRKELWIRVASNIVTAENCMSDSTASNWANAIVDAFDKRFGKPEEP